MPIRVRLDRILLDHRMSLTELADRVGVTIANLSILKTGKARAVRFSTLDALCRELDCQPGDLLSFESGPPDGLADDDDAGGFD
jgi:putative transcriptional regulator